MAETLLCSKLNRVEWMGNVASGISFHDKRSHADDRFLFLIFVMWTEHKYAKILPICCYHGQLSDRFLILIVPGASEFKQSMKVLSGKSKTDINEFIDTVAGYKLTILMDFATVPMLVAIPCLLQTLLTSFSWGIPPKSPTKFFKGTMRWLRTQCVILWSIYSELMRK